MAASSTARATERIRAARERGLRYAKRVPPITHVIFDMDGVLLDTEPLYTQATQQVVGAFGKVFDWSIKCEMMGRGALDAAKYLVERLSLPISPEEYLRRHQPELERLCRRAEAKVGAEHLVEALHDRGVPIAVATSSRRALFALKTERHGWFERFDAVVCGDDPRVQRSKPAPDIFLVAAADLGATPNACLVFEDSPAGVEAAHAAGMFVVALPDPNMDRSRYPLAHRIIESFADVDLDELRITPPSR